MVKRNVTCVVGTVNPPPVINYSCTRGNEKYTQTTPSYLSKNINHSKMKHSLSYFAYNYKHNGASLRYLDRLAVMYSTPEESNVTLTEKMPEGKVGQWPDNVGNGNGMTWPVKATVSWLTSDIETYKMVSAKNEHSVSGPQETSKTPI